MHSTTFLIGLFAWSSYAYPQGPDINDLAASGPGYQAVDELMHGAAKDLTITVSPLTVCTGNTLYTNPIYNTAYPIGVILSYSTSRDLYGNEGLALFQPAHGHLCGTQVARVYGLNGGACHNSSFEISCFSLLRS